MMTRSHRLQRGTMVASVLAVALALLGAAGPASANPQPKVSACQLDKQTGTYHPKLVSASSYHPDKGDYLADPSLDGWTVFAVAYTNLDGVAGYSICDMFIAALADNNADQTPGPGDAIITHFYPTSFAPPYNFVPFEGITQVGGVFCGPSQIHTDDFTVWINAPEVEHAWHLPGPGSVRLFDSLTGGTDDYIADGDLSIIQTDSADNAFLDVDLYVTSGCVNA